MINVDIENESDGKKVGKLINSTTISDDIVAKFE